MNIIITGGSRGLGRAAALELSGNSNNQIILTGRNEELLRETARMAENGNIGFYAADLSDADQLKLFCEHAASEFSIIDILINNAGYLVNKPFTELTDEELHKMIAVNYLAPASLTRQLLPLMRRGSHILNISSMGGFQGSVKFAGLAGYSASKAALGTLTECLAAEFATEGIAVNCLSLGSAQTEMLAEAFPGYSAPLSAEAMGGFISWFAVNGNKYFNGKILPVALTTP
jgi:NAD(P)-dependent dehydrogenase (short-subunit alcohol dehydrogenase family)